MSDVSVIELIVTDVNTMDKITEKTVSTQNSSTATQTSPSKIIEQLNQQHFQ